MFAKFFLPSPDACNLQPAVSNVEAPGHELLVQYWHTQQAACRFKIVLSLPRPNNTVSIHLSADSYLWSLHLVVSIAQTMFKWIF